MDSSGFKPWLMPVVIIATLVLTGAVIYFGSVMLFIILSMLALMGAVIYFGAQHDPHTNIRSEESSRAVQTLREQRERAERKLASQKTETGDEA